MTFLITCPVSPGHSISKHAWQFHLPCVLFSPCPLAPALGYDRAQPLASGPFPKGSPSPWCNSAQVYHCLLQEPFPRLLDTQSHVNTIPICPAGCCTKYILTRRVQWLTISLTLLEFTISNYKSFILNLSHRLGCKLHQSNSFSVPHCT